MCSLSVLDWSFIELALILIQSTRYTCERWLSIFDRTTVLNCECQSLCWIKVRYTDWIQSQTLQTTKDLSHSPKISKPAHVHVVSLLNTIESYSPLGRTNDLRTSILFKYILLKFEGHARIERVAGLYDLPSIPHRNFTCCLCAMVFAQVGKARANSI